MNKFLLYVILFGHSFLAHSQQADQKPHPVVVNVSLHQQNDQSQNQKSDLNSDAKSGDTSQSTLSQQSSQAASDSFESNKQYCKEISANFYSWAKNNGFKVLGIGIVASYSFVLYQIYSANLIIFNPLAWSNWKNGCSLEQIFATPQATLESEILYAFQNRHIDVFNPTDFMYSLVQSAISLQHEIYVIESQIARYELILKCKCPQLFFVKAEAIDILREKHKKLLFIKHIFASWCTRYKIEKNN